MRRIAFMLSAIAVLIAATASPGLTGSTDPLFISLTSDDAHRSFMAISFGQAQMQRGHPLTLYLSDKGVLVADKKNGAQFAEQQQALADIAAKGGMVLVCPVCSQKFGVAASDLPPGAKFGNPDTTGAALFQDGGKTLSW